MDHSPEDRDSELTPDQEEILSKLLPHLPRDVALVNGKKKSLLDYYGSKPSLVPPRVYPHTSPALSALLAPLPEQPSVRSKKMIGKGETARVVRNSGTQPRIYGIQNLFPLLANLLRPDHILGDHDPVTLNVGMGADIPPNLGDTPLHLTISPALPGYTLLGIERLKELREVTKLREADLIEAIARRVAKGKDVGHLRQVTERARLRIFSTGSLNAILNRKDPRQIEEVQQLQRELLDAFIAEFYPDLIEYIDTSGMTAKVPLLGRREYENLREKMMPRLTPAIIKSLDRSGKKYGALDIEAAIKYAVHHNIPETFGDGGPGKYEVTVGGWSEDTFMAVRGFNESDDPQCRVGIVVRGPLAKTPAYLHRPTEVSTNGRKVNVGEVTMEEFLEEGNSRVERIIQDPHGGDRSMFVRKDLDHIGRCIAGRGNEGEGIARLRDFYQGLYNGR